jgi:hypothetical protein
VAILKSTTINNVILTSCLVPSQTLYYLMSYSISCYINKVLWFSFSLQLSVIFFFGGRGIDTRVWMQGLTLARLAFYHLSYAPPLPRHLFCLVYFSGRVLYFLPRPASDQKSFISTSFIAGLSLLCSSNFTLITSPGLFFEIESL